MADIGSVQVLATPGAATPTENASGSRQRAQDAAESRLADARGATFTAKFGNLRIVSGAEAAAIENVDLNALRDIRFARDTAAALVAQQEVQDDGDAPAATDTENADTQPASADSGEQAAPDTNDTAAPAFDSSATTATLDAPAPTDGGAEIDVQAAGGGNDSGDSGAAVADTEDALPAPTGGGGGGFERGAVLDIVV
jgi:hypothetical protein